MVRSVQPARRSILKTLALTSLAAGALLAWPGETSAAALITRSAGGANAAAIQATVDTFRNDLGTLNANVAGSFGSGRREINWDGGGAVVDTSSPTPFNGFQATRGTLFTTPGTGFRQDFDEFLDLNANYPPAFQTFSPVRLFSPLGSVITDTTFFIPGSSSPATVRGFGAVFTDVDLFQVTSLELFNAGGTSLGTFFAPVANNGFSFLGVFGNAGEQIGRVRINSGNLALAAAPAGNEAPGLPEFATDTVAMDDFILGEPVPEPSSLGLMALAGAALLPARRRD